MADGSGHILLGKEWRRRTFDPRKILKELVRWCELARGRVAQHGVESAFRFAGEYCDAHVPAGAEVDGVTVQHRQAPGNVEPADHDWYSGPAKRSRDVEGARILI